MANKNNLIDYNNVIPVVKERMRSKGKLGLEIADNDLGTIISEVIGGLVSMLQYNQSAIVRNTSYDTATSASAIKTKAISQGYQIYRNRGSSVKVLLTRKDPPFVGNIVIPKFTVFNINDYKFYNSEPINLVNGYETAEFTLKQGEPKTETFTCSGEPMNAFQLAVGDFKIDHFSVEVTTEKKDVVFYKQYQVFDDEIPGTISTFYDGNTVDFLEKYYGNYIDRTNGDGTVSIVFSPYQELTPEAGTNVVVSYAVCEGSSSNLSNEGIEVTSDILNFPSSNYSIITTSAITGGEDTDNEEDIRYLAPRMKASNYNAVKREDYKAWILRYGGAYDVAFWAEAEEQEMKGTTNPILMNRYYYAPILKNIKFMTENKEYKKEIEFSEKDFSRVFNTKVLPGSLIINIEEYPAIDNINARGVVHTFVDSTNGVVFSNTDSLPLLDIINDIKTNDKTSVDPRYTPSNMIDGNPDTYYESLEVPTYINPLRIGFNLNLSSAKVNAFRLKYPFINGKQSSIQSVRAFTNTDSNWSVDSRINLSLIYPNKEIRPNVGNNYSEWFILDRDIESESGLTTQALILEISSTYGANQPVRISEIELAYIDRNNNYIKYSNGEVKFSSPETISNIKSVTCNYYTQGDTSNYNSSIQEWMKDKKELMTELQIRDINVYPFKFECNVYYKYTTSDVFNLQNSLLNDIQEFFRLRYGSINSSIELSDITQVFENNDNVDYVEIIEPTTRIPAVNNTVNMCYSYKLNMIISDRTTSRN